MGKGQGWGRGGGQGYGWGVERLRERREGRVSGFDEGCLMATGKTRTPKEVMVVLGQGASRFDACWYLEWLY